MDGEDDQIVPVKDSAGKPAKLIKGAKNSTIPGASRPYRYTSRLMLI
jgi:non-heme chloroperoxidase